MQNDVVLGQPGERWGKYELISRLGQGGMGEVFLARQMGPSGFVRNVVIKRVLPHLGMNERFTWMFLQEARLTARLEHPNIVQIVELDEQGGEYFLVMEYIHGLQLGDVIEQLPGKPPPGLGTFVVREVCRALFHAYDHRSADGTPLGLVHRDVSPSNIMLGFAGSVKLLDFGVAKAAQSLELTDTGELKGKLAFMAPERVLGQEGDHRADLFSAGVVLYQALTGQRLFNVASPIELMERHRAPPPPPSTLNPSVPPALDRICLQALDHDPERRFATGAVMADALDDVLFDLKWGSGQLVSLLRELEPERARAGPPGSATQPTLPQGDASPPQPRTPSPSPGRTPTVSPIGAVATAARRARWRWIAVAAGIFMLLSLYPILHVMRQHRAVPTVQSLAASKTPRRSVVVLGFKNLSGTAQLSWLSTALSEMLVSELVLGGRLRVPNGEDVARMKRELGLGDADSLSAESLAGIRRNLGADLVLLGSYTALESASPRPLRIDLRVQDTGTAETVATVTLRGTEAELFKLVDRAGDNLRQHLGVPLTTESERRPAHGVLPANLEAARYYSEGLQHLRIDDAPTARELLEKAVAADPQQALSHATLAQALGRLGYDLRAQEEAKRALALAQETSLSPEERLSVEAIAFSLRHEWAKAIEKYQALYDFFPDNLDYGLRLADALQKNRRGSDATKVLAELRRRPAPERDDPRLDLLEASLSQEMERRAALSATARAKAEARGALLLVAAAQTQEAGARARMGQCAQVGELTASARRICVQAGDLAGALLALGISTDCLDGEPALSMKRELLQMAEKLGDRRALAEALSDVADSAGQMGRWDEARPAFQRALAIDRELDNRGRAGIHRTNFADALLSQGRLVDALKLSDEALADQRATGHGSRLALALGMHAEILWRMGDVATATQNLTEALAEARAVGDRKVVYEYLPLQAGMLETQGKLAEAQKSASEWLRSTEELKVPGYAAHASLCLASLDLDHGNAGGAETRVRQVLQRFTNNEELVMSAQLVLMHALVRQGELDAAKQVLARAEAAPRPHNFDSLAEMLIARARLDAATGARGAARHALQSRLADARRAHYVLLKLRLRRLLAELGGVAASTTAETAEERGFTLIVRSPQPLGPWACHGPR
jgi:serine/threonine protein kinase/tetratricopeptide (TPR) repeat protein